MSDDNIYVNDIERFIFFLGNRIESLSDVKDDNEYEYSHKEYLKNYYAQIQTFLTTLRCDYTFECIVCNKEYFIFETHSTSDEYIDERICEHCNE